MRIACRRSRPNERVAASDDRDARRPAGECGAIQFDSVGRNKTKTRNPSARQSELRRCRVCQVRHQRTNPQRICAAPHSRREPAEGEGQERSAAAPIRRLCPVFLSNCQTSPAEGPLARLPMSENKSPSRLSPPEKNQKPIAPSSFGSSARCRSPVSGRPSLGRFHGGRGTAVPVDGLKKGPSSAR